MSKIHPEFANRNFITGLPDFQPFSKMARLNREVIVTEKIDGTNAQIYIGLDGSIFAGSRNRWITPNDDNFGFARWVWENKDELVNLGPGRHFGEWWGGGIQRGYGLKEKRFSLFNVGRWFPAFPEDGFNGVVTPGLRNEDGSLVKCCYSVPVIWRGDFDVLDAWGLVEMLRVNGSFAAPGFMKPEGIVLYHTAAGQCFKVTLENDESPKSQIKNETNKS